MGKVLRLIIRSQWDRATAVAAASVALLALLLGWVGVATTSFPAEQVPYVVSGGIGAILLMAVAATLWISADIRDEWRKLHELGSKLDAIHDDMESALEVMKADAGATQASTDPAPLDSGAELVAIGNHSEPNHRGRAGGRRGTASN